MMIDPFVLLTPVLLLGVMALLRFAGCLLKPDRPDGRGPGWILDPNDRLAANLVGLFIMNEGSGTTDVNLVDNQPASSAGSSRPTWNTDDPSIVFNGGGSLNSFLDAGTDLNFDQLTTSGMTIVAKVYVNAPLAAAGICEKNDGNMPPGGDSGFVFGWDANGALRLTVERSGTNMQVATIGSVVKTDQWMQVAFTWDGMLAGPSPMADAQYAHLFVDHADQTDRTQDQNGSGTLNYVHATDQPFRIGNASYDVAGSLNGKMEYLAIYRGKILSAGDMHDLDTKLPTKGP